MKKNVFFILLFSFTFWVVYAQVAQPNLEMSFLSDLSNQNIDTLKKDSLMNAQTDSIISTESSIVLDDNNKTEDKEENVLTVTKTKSNTRDYTASHYGGSFHGRKTASGEIYNQNALTAASNNYKLGTWVRVFNKKNKKSVDVLINDRMHPKMKKRIDLSRAAFKEIASLNQGLVSVEVVVIK